MDARPPESEVIIPRRILRSRAYQLAQEPESLVTIAPSGRRGESSQVTRCGLTGFAGCMARSSGVFHQSLTLRSTFSRQPPFDFTVEGDHISQERWANGNAVTTCHYRAPERALASGTPSRWWLPLTVVPSHLSLVFVKRCQRGSAYFPR